MGAPQAGNSIEAMFLGEKFSFDEPSSELGKIRCMLLSGISTVFAPTDIPDGNGGESRTEVVASFFQADGEQYLSDLRRVHRDNLADFSGEKVVELGDACPGTKRIMDAIAAGCTIYLVPEEEDGLRLRYTLCILA